MTCVRYCCESKIECDLAFMLKDRCYLLKCFSEDRCQALPARGEDFSFNQKMAFVAPWLFEKNKKIGTFFKGDRVNVVCLWKISVYKDAVPWLWCLRATNHSARDFLSAIENCRPCTLRSLVYHLRWFGIFIGWDFHRHTKLSIFIPGYFSDSSFISHHIWVEFVIGIYWFSYGFALRKRVSLWVSIIHSPSSSDMSLAFVLCSQRSIRSFASPFAVHPKQALQRLSVTSRTASRSLYRCRPNQ